jgi:hypothetical protein
MRSTIISKRFESRPLRSTGVLNIATFNLVKFGFVSCNESPLGGNICSISLFGLPSDVYAGQVANRPDKFTLRI